MVLDYDSVKCPRCGGELRPHGPLPGAHECMNCGARWLEGEDGFPKDHVFCNDPECSKCLEFKARQDRVERSRDKAETEQGGEKR